MRNEVEDGIKKAVKDIIGVECKIDIFEVIKNNGVTRTCVTIKETDAQVSPTIYIDHMLEKWRNGFATFKSIAMYVVDVYENHKKEGNRLYGIATDLSKEKILSSVVYKLINKEKNMDFAEYKPYKDFLDYMVVYRVSIANGEASFDVTNEVCRTYKISNEELDEAAWKNTKEKSDFKVQSMAQALAEVTGEPLDNEYDDSTMYVLSNDNKAYGATVLLYTEYFEKIADRINEDLYVIPSSVHEVLAVPASMIPGYEHINRMIREVNENVVDEEEILGDKALMYSRYERRLMTL